MRIAGVIVVFISFIMTFMFMALDLKYPHSIYSTLRGVCAVVTLIGIIPLGGQLYDVMGGPWIVRIMKRRAEKKAQKREKKEYTE